MSLASTSIRRPVLTVVMSVFILLLGVIGLFQVGVREYPSVDPAVINVTTLYKGASAEVVSNQITEILEQSINGIDGIRSLTSSSLNERSNIAVEFDLGIDLERAANDVRDRVSRIQKSLPVDADPPTVSKADANAMAIIRFSLWSPKRSLLELSDLATHAQDLLQTISGVSEVRILGEQKYSIHVRMDPTKLAAFGLTPSDVQTALSNANVNLPSGQLEGNSVALSIQSRTGLSTPEEFARVIVRQGAGRVVRVEDVARVDLAAENERTLFRSGTTPTIGVFINSQPGANQIDIVDQALKRIEELKRDLPPDVQLELLADNTRFVRNSLKEVQETIWIAFALVVLVIFAFLRDWRSTLIPVLAIPISLVGVFFLVWLLGFSVNVLTLLGIVLAIGLVVDDAIVVLENIYAKIESGLSPRKAALEGVEEIFFAVVSTTVVLVAVFTPLLFMPGFTGRLFREFGFVIGGSVLISGFIALTLVGMLSSRLLHAHSETRLHRLTEPFFDALTNGYARVLAVSTRRPWIAFPILLVAFLAMFVAFQNLPREIAPLDDRSSLSVQVFTHEGASFGYTDAVMRRVSDIASREVPEAASNMTMTSSTFNGVVNNGFTILTLVPPDRRERSQQAIAQALSAKLSAFPGIRAFVTQDQTISTSGQGSSLPVQIVLESSSLDSLRRVLPLFVDKAQADPVFSVVDVNLKFTKPQLDVSVDRDRLQSVGVTPLELASTLQLAYGGMRYGYFQKNGKQYQVIGEVDSSRAASPRAFEDLYVRGAGGKLLSVAGLVDLSESDVPPQLYHTNRFLSATVSAGLAPGHSLGEGVDHMRAIAASTLNPSFHTELAGTSRDFAESSNSLLQIFLLALVIVYLILAAQFESFRDPLVIMLTVPLALAGALLGLWATGNTLNLFSEIGLVMLIGLVTKNGILIVEFANQRREAGLSTREAVVAAAAARLRPILMTTLCAILGILPIALSLGASSKARAPMGVAVVGGLSTALVLTLVVVPSMYLLLAPKHLSSEEDRE